MVTIRKGKPAQIEVSLSAASSPMVRVPPTTNGEGASIAARSMAECSVQKEITVLRALLQDVRSELALVRDLITKELESLRVLVESLNASLKELSSANKKEESSKVKVVPKKDFYNTAEAAILLGKAKFTVRKNCASGAYAAHKVPGRMHGEHRISHQEIVRLQMGGGRADEEEC